jgi:hypothetical protein
MTNLPRTIAIACALTTLTALPLFAAACSGQPERPSTGSSSAALTSADPVSALSGTWVFTLDESDVATKVRAGCQGESGGDKAKEDACYGAVRAEGATEKLRFSKDPQGHTLWTSFGQKGDETDLFLEVSMDLSAESPTTVAGKVVGEPRGRQAKEASHHMPPGGTLRFEIVDDHTIAMSDPAKGRLVFHKQ